VIAFLADENLKRKIISGLLRRNPSVDVVREQAVDELLMIAECSGP